MTLDRLMNLVKPQTQDKTYQIGQISEKTGLQKTANGWVKPKSANGGNKEKFNASADKISKRSGGKFKLTENKDPAKKGKYELKIGNKSYMVNSTEEAENFVDGYMETKEKTGSKPAISESGYGFTRGSKHYSRAK